MVSRGNTSLRDALRSGTIRVRLPRAPRAPRTPRTPRAPRDNEMLTAEEITLLLKRTATGTFGPDTRRPRRALTALGIIEGPGRRATLTVKGAAALKAAQALMHTPAPLAS